MAVAGYTAKGIVYFMIGALALYSAFNGGGGGQESGSKGALETISNSSFGHILIILVGLGLLCYGLYRLLGAFMDVEAEGSDKEGIAKRLGYLGSGVSYTALAIACFTGLGGGGDKKSSLAQTVMEMPGGRFIVGAVGVAIITAGIFQIIKAVKEKYKSKFSLDHYAAKRRNLINKIAKAGLISRGVIFPIIGYFVVMAAVDYDPSKVIGIGEALTQISQESYGTFLLILTAAGLACYGVYCGIIAAYGRWHQSS